MIKTAILLAFLFHLTLFMEGQIIVKPHMVFNLNAVKGKDLYRCFDNDLASGIDNTGSSNDSFRSLSFSSFIALDSITDINDLRYYVAGKSSGRLIIRFYDASKRSIGRSFSLITRGYNKEWINIPVNYKLVRRVEINAYNEADLNSSISEIQLFGKGNAKAPSIYPKPVEEKPIDQGIYAHGVNIIVDRIYRKDQDGDSILKKVARSARIYWEGQAFDYFPNTYNNRLIQSPLWLGRYQKDHTRNLLLALKKWDIKPMMTKTGGSIKWLNSSEAADNDSWLWTTSAQGKRYLEPGANPEMDSSWKPLAEQYYRLIALYGNNPAADLSGAVIIGGSSQKGQNLMDIFEWDNEPSRWWSQDYYHSPKAYYEAIRAVYNRGKQADPGARIFAGALPGIDTTYWKALFFIHYLQFGTSPFPADGFNFNAYINDANKGQREGEFAISPESWGTLDMITGLQSFFSKFFPGKQVQWTEFGFATDDGSPYDVNQIGEKTERKVQADWTLRLKAITQTVKFISRMYYYSFFEDNTQPFNSMALISDKFDSRSKYQYSTVQPVAYALANELYTEQDYNFYADIVQNGNSSQIWVTRKDHISQRNKKLYKVWIGTATGKNYPNFSLTVKGARKAKLMQLNYKGFKPSSKNIDVINGKMVFPISEAMSWLEVEF